MWPKCFWKFAKKDLNISNISTFFCNFESPNLELLHVVKFFNAELHIPTEILNPINRNLNVSDVTPDGSSSGLPYCHIFVGYGKDCEIHVC